MSGIIIPYGFGTGPFGTMPAGTAGPIVSAIDRVTVEAENRLRLHFNTAPLYVNLEVQNDAYDVAHYTLTEDTSCLDRLGDPTRPVAVVSTSMVDALTIDLITDRPMSSFPGCYSLAVVGLKDAVLGSLFADQTLFLFGMFKGIPSFTKEQTSNNRDIANPQTFEALFDPLPIEGQQTNDAILGAWPSDHRGDIAFDEGVVSYKKRVFRRLSTRKGAFAHLPDYGSDLLSRVKELAVPGVRDALAVDAEEQIRQEPETVDVSVRIRTDTQNPGLHYFVIKARLKVGQTIFTVPVNSNRN